MTTEINSNLKPQRIQGVRTFKRKDKILLVDPETASWVIVDQTAMPLYEECNGQLTIAQLAEKFSIDISVLNQWITNVYMSGMIYLDDDRRISPEKFKTFTERYPTLCILHTSNKCNLKCRYCYAHPETAPKEDMPFEVMKKAIDEMISLPRQKPFFSIEFHGGEPLAHFPAIRQAVEYGKKCEQEKGISILYQIQSNGTIINDDIMDFLADNHIKLRISFDGVKDIHDENRVFHNGEGSFDVVLKNVKMLQDRGIPFEVITVVCQTNIDRLFEVVDFFLENDINAMRLIPMWVQGNADKSLALSPEQFEKKYLELIKKIVNYNLDNYVKISNLNLKYLFELVVSWERNFMCFRSPCGAGLDMIDFSVTGDIYPCEEMNEQGELRVGNIFESSLKEIIDNSDLIKTLKTRRTDLIEKCSKCTWKLFCNGGCANKVHLNYGTIFHESEFCSFFENIFPDLIWLISETPGASSAVLNT